MIDWRQISRPRYMVVSKETAGAELETREGSIGMKLRRIPREGGIEIKIGTSTAAVLEWRDEY